MVARRDRKDVRGNSNVKSATRHKQDTCPLFSVFLAKAPSDFFAGPASQILFTNAAAFYAAIKIFYCSWRKFKATIKRVGVGSAKGSNNNTATRT